jgi:hypothetical protein
MMAEIWLRTNRRALAFGAVPPLVVAAIGGWMMQHFAATENAGLRWTGVALIALGGAFAVAILLQLRTPRIAYRAGEVLFHLRSGPPLAVPVELVEAFFLGQGPLMVKGTSQGSEAVNLVARISQRDPSYAKREVKPALGNWCESYVTIRGLWCEPLNGEVVRRLNRRLREVSEARAAALGQFVE